MDAREYLLVKLMEECAEVTHRTSKALTFGLDDYEWGQTLTNNQRLSHELNDLMAVVEMLVGYGILEFRRDPIAVAHKRGKVIRYMAYSQSLGTLTFTGEDFRWIDEALKGPTDE